MSDVPTTVLPLEQVQSGVFDPSVLAEEVHLFVQITDPSKARATLRSLVADVTTEASPAPNSRLSLGFTWAGLCALRSGADGTPLDDDEPMLQSFPGEFQQGMRRRSTVLGDNGPSAPAEWDPHYNSDDLHVWVMLQEANTASLERRQSEVTALLEADGAMTVLINERGSQFGADHAPAKEHFGFNDNLGQPGVEGAGQPVQPGQGTYVPETKSWKPIPTGCFALGYENGYGEVETRPSDETIRLNGTYMVFRKLEQHVTAFRSYVAETADDLGIDPELCAAKFVGRWRSGAPLAKAPDHDDPTIVDDPTTADDFLYSAAEGPDGGCPVPHFAHIRRVNPRDSLDPRTGVDPTNHRIIRRSAPYGTFLPDGADDDHTPRGLLFRAFNASILDQFELVQSQWVNSANESHGMSSDTDPFVGTRVPQPEAPTSALLDRQLGSSFTIPLADGSCPTRYDLPQFVTVKGGAYLFVPSVDALHHLTAEPAPAAPAPGLLDVAAKFPLADRENQIKITMLAQKTPILFGEYLRSRDDTAIFPTPLGFIVSTMADTLEVFARDDEFSVDGYGQRMNEVSGPFMLGMDRGEQYDHEHSIMQFVAPSTDLGAIQRWLHTYVEQLISQLEAEYASDVKLRGPGASIDLVTQIADRVPLAFLGHYIGVPGPNDETLMTWLHAIATYVFEFWSPVVPGLSDAARDSGLEMSAYLEHLIDTRAQLLTSKPPDAPDDILTRLLRLGVLDPPAVEGRSLGLTRVGIRRNLAGFSLGSVVAASMSIVAAMGYLLDPANAAEREIVTAAARGGDDDLFRRCMLEAYRLGSPAPPTLFRVASADVVLAEGTERATPIPKGSVVAIYPCMAMTDEKAVTNPKSFDPHRDESCYVMFGEGLHKCFGTAIATMFLTSVGRALLEIDGLTIAGEPSSGSGVANQFYPGRLPLAIVPT